MKFIRVSTIGSRPEYAETPFEKALRKNVELKLSINKNDIENILIFPAEVTEEQVEDYYRSYYKLNLNFHDFDIQYCNSKYYNLESGNYNQWMIRKDGSIQLSS